MLKSFILKTLFAMFLPYVKPDLPATIEAFTNAFCKHLEPYQINLLAACFYYILYEVMPLDEEDLNSLFPRKE